jgi:hypothetical protein
MSLVSMYRFQLTLRSGVAGLAGGMKRLAAQPASARTSSMADTIAVPPSARISSPPAMVPSRMARKVPASSRALAPTSSCSLRCSGSRPYLSGLKLPMRKRTPIRK